MHIYFFFVSGFGNTVFLHLRSGNIGNTDAQANAQTYNIRTGKHTNTPTCKSTYTRTRKHIHTQTVTHNTHIAVLEIKR